MRLQAGVIVPFLRRRNCDPGYYHHQVQNKPLLSIFCVLQASLELFQLNFREQILLPASCHSSEVSVGRARLRVLLIRKWWSGLSKTPCSVRGYAKDQNGRGPPETAHLRGSHSTAPGAGKEEEDDRLLFRWRVQGKLLIIWYRDFPRSLGSEFHTRLLKLKDTCRVSVYVTDRWRHHTAGFEDRDDKVKDAGSPEPTGGPQAGARTALLEPLLTSDLQNHR